MKRTLGQLALAAGFFAVVPATGAFAQAGTVTQGKVCVYMESGGNGGDVGYVAAFYLTTGGRPVSYSNTFLASGWLCISAEMIADWAKFQINVRASRGIHTISDVQCKDLDGSTDFVKVAGNPYPLMFLTSRTPRGTAFDLRCYLPIDPTSASP